MLKSIRRALEQYKIDTYKPRTRPAINTYRYAYTIVCFELFILLMSTNIEIQLIDTKTIIYLYEFEPKQNRYLGLCMVLILFFP